MSCFRDFEVQVLRTLGESTIGTQAMGIICRDAEFVSYDYSKAGYFLTVRHPMIPKESLVLHAPLISGLVGEVIGTFLAFVGENELTLEFAGFTDVPENIRDLAVRVEVEK